MTTLDPLDADRLCTRCDPECFEFETTADLDPLEEIIGQDRAVEAVEFGLAIRRHGFHIFAYGPRGSGKSTTIRHFLRRYAEQHEPPRAWCYVHNFETPNRPRALELPPGRAQRLGRDMRGLIEELLVALPEAFEAEAYHTRRARLMEGYERRHREAYAALQQEVSELGLTVVEREDGLAVAPLSDGEVMSSEAFGALSEEEQSALRERMREAEGALDGVMRAARALEREAAAALRALEREVALIELESRLGELRQRYEGQPAVLAHLSAVKEDILDRLDLFLARDEADDPTRRALDPAAAARRRRRTSRELRRYEVNVLVDPGDASSAPVVVEPLPTLAALVGRIEQESRMGALVTDFTLIKPGALHRANGGYLVLEAEEVVKRRASWEALKRALANREVSIEPPDDGRSPLRTITLEPEPIPLDLKVILIGEPELYFGLHEVDGDVPELFKVGAEFSDSMPRTTENDLLYARFIATTVEREALRPFTRAAVARVIEYSARRAEDAERLSMQFRDITDLLREADYWASRSTHEAVARDDVERAIEARIERADHARELLHEAFARDILLLDVDGTAVGQLNGLTLLERGSFRFGLPVRISARVRQGGGEVIDIAREVELGGPIHSKGVLTLSGFIGGRYAVDELLAIQASLSFEQSYAEIEGDSASSAELYALLSALAGLPLRQGLAVTGAVNQGGEVQAIGGVNEKIEGFFDICEQRGLTGEQGVLIPAANAQHLMLRADVVDAVRDGRFAIYAVEHVDEGLALLAGQPAGERGASGEFPRGSVNRLVEDRLRALAAKRAEVMGHDDLAVDGA